MNPEPSREELISAYLDGELPPEKRAEVEKWLAESLPLRQLHDELRALRSSIESLPRHKLERDLAPTVLRRAERTVLGGAAERSVAGKIQPGELVRSWWARGGWRRWAWPAVVAAAALLLLLFDNQQPPAERQIARAPKSESFIGPARDGRISDKDAAKPPPAHKLGEHESDAKSPAVDEIDGYKAREPAAAREEKSARQLGRPTLAKSAQNQMGIRVESPAPAEGLPAGRPQDASNIAGAARGADAKTLPQAAFSLKNNLGPVPQQPPDVVCDVTGEFIRQGTFEKSLEKRKVRWQRSDLSQMPQQSQPANSKSLAARKRQQAAKPQREAPQGALFQYEPLQAGQQVEYSVTATPEQLDEIVIELEADKSGVKKVSSDTPRVQNLRAQRKITETPSPVRFLLQTAPAPGEGEGKPKE